MKLSSPESVAADFARSIRAGHSHHHTHSPRPSLHPGRLRSREAFTYPTAFDIYRATRGVKPNQLAKTAGISRQHLRRVRMGTASPSAALIYAIVCAMIVLTGDLSITAAQLFHIQPITDPELEPFRERGHRR